MVSDGDVDDILREIRPKQMAELRRTASFVTDEQRPVEDIIRQAVRNMLEAQGPTYPSVLRDWPPERMAQAIKTHIQSSHTQLIGNMTEGLAELPTDSPSMERIGRHRRNDDPGKRHR